MLWSVLVLALLSLFFLLLVCLYVCMFSLPRNHRVRRLLMRGEGKAHGVAVNFSQQSICCGYRGECKNDSSKSVFNDPTIGQNRE